MMQPCNVIARYLAVCKQSLSEKRDRDFTYLIGFQGNPLHGTFGGRAGMKENGGEGIRSFENND